MFPNKEFVADNILLRFEERTVKASCNKKFSIHPAMLIFSFPNPNDKEYIATQNDGNPDIVLIYSHEDGYWNYKPWMLRHTQAINDLNKFVYEQKLTPDNYQY